MHTLMSFVGCVGKLMADSGLEEVMKAAFGGVTHMLVGKTFPHNVGPCDRGGSSSHYSTVEHTR